MTEIILPTEDTNRTKFRAIAESLAQLNSITAALATFYGYTHPKKFEEDMDLWRKEITTASNRHDALIEKIIFQLEGKAKVSLLAQEVAFYLVRTSVDGMTDPVEFDAIIGNFSGIAEEDIEDALAELNDLGFIEIFSFIGKPVGFVRPRGSIFYAFDSIVMQFYTEKDAATLAEKMLRDEEYCSVRKLEESTQWPRRRLNPAILYLIDNIFEEGHYSKTMQPDYPTSFFIITPTERRRLKELSRLGNNI